jgi:predicted DNA-binding protein
MEVPTERSGDSMNIQITLPPDLQSRLEREAAARGVSVADFLRSSLEATLKHNRSEDPLFADHALWRDAGPDDVAEKHDDYLNGRVPIGTHSEL